MRLKIFLFGIIFSLFGIVSFAQIYDPVKWSVSTEASGENEITVTYSARIDKGWSVYSQYLASDDGPIRSSVEYDEGGHFSLVSPSTEKGNRKEGYDNIFEMDVIKFSDTYQIIQKISVKDATKPITGYITYQACDHEKCLPPTDFDFSIDPQKYLNKDLGPDKKMLQKEENKGTAEVNSVRGSDPGEVIVASAKEKKVQREGILSPLKWEAQLIRISDNVFRIKASAEIQEGWNVYSAFTVGDDAPIPTTLYFNENGNVKTVSDIEEKSSSIKKEYDRQFEMELVKIKNDVTLAQTFEAEPEAETVRGFIEYQACDDSRCLPPTEVFFIYDIEAGTLYLGENEEGDTDESAGGTSTGDDNDLYEFAGVDLNNPIGKCGTEPAEGGENKGIMTIFLLGFIGGLLALLTPCVFPMVPLTVSYFTKSAKDKKKGITNAVLYGFFILLTYLILSVPFHLLDSVNPDILNDISTNVWLNLFFFAIFLFFAFSFFGYYELTLPASLTNKVSSAEGVGGIIGIFFMALTLALVSFSCTGPILGSLLAGALSSDGGAWQLTSGMAGFGMALALPFGLFAAFPSWMNNLPKSGGWLNTVKVVLGFLELALAFKFLSNADLVKHWGLLKIEPFLVIWIIIFLLLAAYLFGLIRFPHDSPLKRVSGTRASLAVISLAFSIYLITGFRYNEDTQTFKSLSLLSGLAPPVGYSWLYPNKCPQNLECFHDLKEGMAYARKNNKPVFLDFTGYACVNCRKMEEHVWPKENVLSKLRDKYVVISLYVDDKEELPEDQQIEVTQVTGAKRKLRNYGHKWAHFQATYFHNNSQPYYVLLSPDSELLNTPVGYTPDAEEFASFLKCGLDAFDSKNKSTGKVE